MPIAEPNARQPFKDGTVHIASKPDESLPFLWRRIEYSVPGYCEHSLAPPADGVPSTNGEGSNLSSS